MVRFFGGIVPSLRVVAPMMCCTTCKWQNLVAIPQVAPSAEGGRQQLFRKCFCQICLWVTYVGSRSRQDVLLICVLFVPRYVVQSYFKECSWVKSFFLANTMHHVPPTSFPQSPSSWDSGIGLDPGYSNTWASFFGLSLIPKNPQQLWERLSRSFLIWDHERLKLNLGLSTFATSHPFHFSQSLLLLQIVKRCRTFMASQKYFE